MIVTGESSLGDNGKKQFILGFKTRIQMHKWFSDQGYTSEGRYFVSPEGVKWRKKNRRAVMQTEG